MSIYTYMSIYILNIVYEHIHKIDNELFFEVFFYILQIFYGLTMTQKRR